MVIICMRLEIVTKSTINCREDWNEPIVDEHDLFDNIWNDKEGKLVHEHTEFNADV